MRDSQQREATIAVGRDASGWHDRFAQALSARQSAGFPVCFHIVEMDCDAWVDGGRGRGAHVNGAVAPLAGHAQGRMMGLEFSQRRDWRRRRRGQIAAC